MKLENLIDVNWLSTNGISFGGKLLGAGVIIVVGFWLSRKIPNMLQKHLERTDLTISLRKFLLSLLKISIKMLAILVAMTTMGVETTAFVAILGGTFIGIGMALQGSLSNLAGGLLIMLFKPYKVHDVVESLGSLGTVQEITILQTVLMTPDRKTVILPNGSVFNNPIINYSREGIRRVDVKIGVSYSDDFESIRALLLKVLEQEPLLLPERSFNVEIADFGESTVKLAMNGYCKTEDYLDALWSLNSATKRAMDNNGFNIPFPQRDLHIIRK